MHWPAKCGACLVGVKSDCSCRGCECGRCKMWKREECCAAEYPPSLVQFCANSLCSSRLRSSSRRLKRRARVSFLCRPAAAQPNQASFPRRLRSRSASGRSALRGLRNQQPEQIDSIVLVAFAPPTSSLPAGGSELRWLTEVARHSELFTRSSELEARP